MLKHIVLYKLIDNTLANRQILKDKLMSMQGNIAELKSIEVGFDVISSERSYDVALITTFDDLAALNIYVDHPFHQPVKKFMRTMYEKAVSVDFII